MRSFAAVALFLLASTAHVASLRAAAKPNVLFIAVDDLKPTIGCYGDHVAKTPNIDRLAARGTLFQRAYCMQAVCAPSRNSMLTGLRSETLRIYDLSTNFRRRTPDVVTLPQWFKHHGYASHGVGKIFHVGHGNTDDTASWSVPHFQPGGMSYALAENKERLAREAALMKKPRNPARTGPKAAAYERADVPDNAYADGLIAREAIARLRTLKNEGQPFLLAVGFIKPHLPFCAPSKYWDLYDPAKLPLPDRSTPPDGAPAFAPTNWGELRNYTDIPKTGPLDAETTRTLIHGYYAATSYMDAQLGKVLDELDALGLTNNTIVVFWGDHGWHLGDHGMWCKHSNYEQATRSPLIIAAPGQKSGITTRALTEFIDVYPTVCALAGLEPPTHLDGRSLVPVLQSADVPGKPAAFQVFPRPSRETGQLLGHAVRSDRWRYVEWRKNEGTAIARELYDMANDPGETINLAEKPEHAAVLAEHSRLLTERLATPPPAGLRILDPIAPASAASSALSKPRSGSGSKTKDRGAMFDQRDRDRDGKLTLEEFLRSQPDPDEAPKRFPKFDTNHDGALSREEFIAAGKAPAK